MTLDDALESWARWVWTGRPLEASAISSTGAVMEILRLGVTGPGHNGASRTLDCTGCIEERIEATLMRWTNAGRHHEKRALVLRAEYLMAVPDDKRAQEVRALRLGLPLSTYKRQLANGRAQLAAELAWRG